jgi:hypothetical protein
MEKPEFEQISSVGVSAFRLAPTLPTLLISKVEEPIMNQICNTTGVNLEKVMFRIFLTIAIRNK